MFQLVEDFRISSKSDEQSTPEPFKVKAGEALTMTIRFSRPTCEAFQVSLQRIDKSHTVAADSSLGGQDVCKENVVSPSRERQCSESDICTFADSLPRGFWCPPRLKHRNEALIEIANNRYLASLRDSDWLRFYMEAMDGLPIRGQRVFDLR